MADFDKVMRLINGTGPPHWRQGLCAQQVRLQVFQRSVVTLKDKMDAIQEPMKFIHGPNYSKRFPFTYGIICSGGSNFLLAYITGCLTPSYSWSKQAPKVSFEALSEQ